MIKRITLELQLALQFIASVKVKAYFLEAPMNVSGVAQGQMVGSFIINKYLLYLFFSQRQIGVSFIRKKVYPLHLFFLVVFGGSRGFSGAAQGQMGGSFTRKKLYP